MVAWIALTLWVKRRDRGVRESRDRPANAPHAPIARTRKTRSACGGRPRLSPPIRTRLPGAASCLHRLPQVVQRSGPKTSGLSFNQRALAREVSADRRDAIIVRLQGCPSPAHFHGTWAGGRRSSPGIRLRGSSAHCASRSAKRASGCPRAGTGSCLTRTVTGPSSVDGRVGQPPTFFSYSSGAKESITPSPRATPLRWPTPRRCRNQHPSPRTR
jgi:hypothetical protein